METPSRRCDLVLRDVLLPGGRVADISVRSGRVCHVGEGYPAEERIECRGRTVLPAAIDMHVHMRGWAQREKEDWESGSKSALAGGVTLVVDQPNTVPPIVTPGVLSRRVAEAQEASLCHFAVNAGVVPGVDLESLYAAGAMAFGEIFTAESSYGHGVPLHELGRVFRTARELGALCTVHAEEVVGVPGTDLAAHHAARSPAGEARAVRRVLELNGPGCRLHFCHLSSASAVASAGGATVEVTPHHLLLSIDGFSPGDARGKVNPPLRPEALRKELWSAWDRIDVIASDHAPHTAADKDRTFSDAPAGIPGVETMVPLFLAACRRRKIPITSLVEKTMTNPARILGIPPAGFSVGDRADFAVYPGSESPVSADLLHSRAGWTPFEGMPAVFPEVVVMAGDIVYAGGDFMRGRPRWFHGRGYMPGVQTGNGADTARP
ncbi:MAG: dihydroorotase [Methanolinea sp.]|nr:dihydroorotase [Methanolinea sp.]